MNIKGTVTILDVAREAKVAPSTVSNALAGRNCVKANTRDKILSIAKKMDYHPNIIASSMVTKSTGIIGVFVYNFTKRNDTTYSSFLRGVLNSVNSVKKIKRVLLYADISEENLRLGICKNNEPIDCAIIFCPKADSFRIKVLQDAKIPIVLIGKSDDAKNFSYLDTDNNMIAYNMTKHLIELGHKDIVLVNCVADWVIAEERLNGYKKALQESGIAFNEDLVMNTSFNKEHDIKLFDSIPKTYTAVLSESMDIVVHIYKTESEQGRKVGDKISVAFFGNDERLSLLSPNVTSVSVNYEQMGENAYEILCEMSKNRKNKIHKKFDAKIILTESCRKIN